MAKSGQLVRRHATTMAILLLTACLADCAAAAHEGVVPYMAATTNAADVEIRLHGSFIEHYKNRVTIDAAVTIDPVMPEPAPADQGGELRFSGHAPEVGLPVVADISNAAFHEEAMAIAHRAGGSGVPIKVSGVWRVWPETSNHVFEIHPVTALGGFGLRDSFVPIDGFDPGDAARTFTSYQRASCTLRVARDTVSIVIPAGLSNDVQFLMEITNDQNEVYDGRFVDADVRTLKGALLVPHVRMVFATATAPELAVRRLRRGDRLPVSGIPRLDFAEISRRVKAAGRNSGPITGPLPYEIIVVGTYGNQSLARR